MRNAVLMMLLAGVSSVAAAEWVYVGRDPSGTTVYLDPATVRRSGSTLKMWNLIDYGKNQAPETAKPIFSSNTDVEYDCQQKRVRSLFYSVHSGKMASGELVFLSSDVGDWRPVSPGSVEEVLWNIACRKQ